MNNLKYLLLLSILLFLSQGTQSSESLNQKQQEKNNTNNVGIHFNYEEEQKVMKIMLSDAIIAKNGLIEYAKKQYSEILQSKIVKDSKNIFYMELKPLISKVKSICCKIIDEMTKQNINNEYIDKVREEISKLDKKLTYYNEDNMIKKLQSTIREIFNGNGIVLYIIENNKYISELKKSLSIKVDELCKDLANTYEKIVDAYHNECTEICNKYNNILEKCTSDYTESNQKNQQTFESNKEKIIKQYNLEIDCIMNTYQKKFDCMTWRAKYTLPNKEQKTIDEQILNYINKDYEELKELLSEPITNSCCKKLVIYLEPDIKKAAKECFSEIYNIQSKIPGFKPIGDKISEEFIKQNNEFNIVKYEIRKLVIQSLNEYFILNHETYFNELLTSLDNNAEIYVSINEKNRKILYDLLKYSPQEKIKLTTFVKNIKKYINNLVQSSFNNKWNNDILVEDNISKYCKIVDILKQVIENEQKNNCTYLDNISNELNDITMQNNYLSNEYKMYLGNKNELSNISYNSLYELIKEFSKKNMLITKNINNILIKIIKNIMKHPSSNIYPENLEILNRMNDLNNDNNILTIKENDSENLQNFEHYINCNILRVLDNKNITTTNISDAEQRNKMLKGLIKEKITIKDILQLKRNFCLYKNNIDEKYYKEYEKIINNLTENCASCLEEYKYNIDKSIIETEKILNENEDLCY